MDMDWYSIALMAAGVIGGSTAIVHGILMKRLIIGPIEAVFVANGQISAPIQKIVRLLLHFTTFNWLISGLALIAVAIWFKQDARLVTGLIAGSSFLYGVIISFWVMRRPHPSWILFSVALLLIILGLTPMT